jgi:DNA-binding CsgD family transcriptional regulator
MFRERCVLARQCKLGVPILIADDGHSQLLVIQDVIMNYFDMNLEVHSLRAEEERILACFTRCLHRCLFVRDPEARALLNEAVDQLKTSPRLNPLAAEPIIVQRQDKLPVIMRIWSFDGVANSPAQDVRAVLTLNALGPKPGPPAAIIAKTFRLTPSEAKLASIIARGAPPDIAARELKISRETARNKLKSVFAKTDTHRQSELVALLSQVE